MGTKFLGKSLLTNVKMNFLTTSTYFNLQNIHLKGVKLIKLGKIVVVVGATDSIVDVIRDLCPF